MVTFNVAGYIFEWTKHMKIKFLVLLFILASSSVSYGLTTVGTVQLNEKVKDLVSSTTAAVAFTESGLQMIDPILMERKGLTATENTVKSIAADKSNSLIAILSNNGKDISVMDLTTGEVHNTDYFKNVSTLCIDSKKNQLITASHKDSFLNVINLQSLEPQNRIQLTKHISDIWCYPQEGLLLATVKPGSKEKGKGEKSKVATTLLLININNGEVINKLHIKGHIQAVSTESNGGLAAILTKDGKVLILSLDSMSITPLTSIKNTGDIALIGERLFITNTKEGSLTSLNIFTGEPEGEMYIGKGAEHIAAAQGYLMVSFKGGIKIIRIIKNKITGMVSDLLTGYPLPETIISVTDSAGNLLEATSGNDGKFIINDMESGGYTGNITKNGYHSYMFSGNIETNSEIYIDASMNPVLPVINNLSVTDITESSAQVTWSTEQLADSLIQYGETMAYGNTVSDPTMKTDHAISLMDLSPEKTYHIKAVSTNSFGFTKASSDYSFTTKPLSPTISLSIASPQDGKLVQGSSVFVSGTVFNDADVETGVTVNGNIAVVESGEFFINHLPLDEGENIINVTAVDIYGNTIEKEITVLADTTSAEVTLSANIDSGTAPLDVYFSVDRSIPNSVSTYQIDYEGDGVIDYAGETFDDINFTYTVEGVYYPTVTIIDDQGISYQDFISIVVQDAIVLDALLKDKWEGMKTALAGQDIDKAVKSYTDDKQAYYVQVFNDMFAHLPQFVQDMQDIELIYSKEKVAKYRIRKNEIYVGQPYEITYDIYFVLYKNGIWKIDVF